ncbi:acyltransferase [Ruania suaedae]|uniref:acyltransferase family protein n=1 Tax=Ruania suaedae TaxID=2897774 RepID=UPI001E3C838E|nr:acyltransferase [Ruania suaedae]UFU02193.1 acyltransferase [Ruania suaedae]
MMSEQAGTSSRLPWIDIAKAAAIVLVVHYHVSVAGAPQLLPDSTSAVVAWWRDLSLAMIPLRMPLFFLTAGLLAGGAIQRPWSALWRPRIGNLLWPFLLWSVLFAVLCAPRYDPEEPVRYMRRSLEAIPFGGTAYWFLSVLVVYFVIARLLRRFPHLLLLGAVAAVGLAPLVGSFLTDALGAPDALATNASRAASFAVWYFLGCFARPVVTQIATRATWAGAATATALYVVIAWALYFAGMAASITDLLNLALNVLGLVAALQLAVLASRAGPARRLGHYLAGRTLAIYVLHPILLSGVIVAVRRGDGTAVLPLTSPILNVLLFPLLTVALVAASTALYDLARRVGAPWLFALPGGRTREPR